LDDDESIVSTEVLDSGMAFESNTVATLFTEETVLETGLLFIFTTHLC